MVQRFLNYDCILNIFLFTKLSWTGDSEQTFRSSSHAAAYVPTLGSGLTLPFILLNVVHEIPIFTVFAVTRAEIVPGVPFQNQILHPFDQGTCCEANQFNKNLPLQTGCVKKSHTGNCIGINHFNIVNERSLTVFIVSCCFAFFMRVHGFM